MLNEIELKFVKYVLEKYKKYGNNGTKILTDMYNDKIIVEDHYGYEIDNEYGEESIFNFIFGDEDDNNESALFYTGYEGGMLFKNDHRVKNIYDNQKEKIFKNELKYGDNNAKDFYIHTPDPNSSDCPDLVYVSPHNSHHDFEIMPLTDSAYENSPIPDVLIALKKCFKLSDEEIEKMLK